MNAEQLQLPERRPLHYRVGVILYKPDAVELGIVEELIDHVSTKLQSDGVAQLNGVYPVQFAPNDVTTLYTQLPPRSYTSLRTYLSEGPSVITTYVGNGSTDLLDLFDSRDVKGGRLLSRNEHEFRNKGGLNDSLRSIIPVPGTIEKFKAIMEKVASKRADKNIEFTDEEFMIYCRNLVHTPGSIRELCALLSFLNPEQLAENLDPADLKDFYQRRKSYKFTKVRSKPPFAYLDEEELMESV